MQPAEIQIRQLSPSDAGSFTVVSTNQPALRLYQSFGFQQYGLEKNALKHNNQYSDEILMSLDLV